MYPKHYLHNNQTYVFGLTATAAISLGGLALSAGEAAFGGGSGGGSGGSSGGGGSRGLSTPPNTAVPITTMAPTQLQDSKAAAVVEDKYNPAQQMQQWSQNIMKTFGMTQEPGESDAS